MKLKIAIMKNILLLCTLFIQISSFAQTNFEFIQDTLKIYEDKVLIGFKTYHNSTVSSEGIAFIYEDTLITGNRKFFKQIFNERRTPVLRVEYHGTITQYLENGNYKIGEYENGATNNVKYYDAKGIEISKTAYYEFNVKSHSSLESGIFYIINETKERENNPNKS